MAAERYVKHVTIDKLKIIHRASWILPSFDLELTARCNLDCKHCYISQPARCSQSQQKELSAREISDIADQAISLGAIACLVTGGEPFLRDDFPAIYRSLKQKGLIITIFTNGTLINEHLVNVLSQYPPRFLEVTAYGATRGTFEKITRTPGSYNAFLHGIDLLKKNNIPLRLKSMLMRSNMHEQAEIKNFCLAQAPEQYRFDPFLHLRFDGDEKKNNFIRKERLTPKEIVQLEKADVERYSCLQKNRKNFFRDKAGRSSDLLFFCGAGKQKCVIGYDGNFRLCESLVAPGFVFDTREVSLEDAFAHFVPKVRSIRSQSEEYAEKCSGCSIINLCMWCPAHAYLETGSLDKHVDYFCEIAKERKRMISKKRGPKSGDTILNSTVFS